MQKKHAIAFAAAVMIGAALAPNAQAMSLSSLSRQYVPAKSDEIVTNSIPHAPATPRALDPKFQLILFTIGNFLREHAQYALAEGQRAQFQLVTFASR